MPKTPKTPENLVFKLHVHFEEMELLNSNSCKM